MKYLFYIFLFVGSFCYAQIPYSVRYPYARLNDDHGILTESDLKLSIEDTIPGPYNPTKFALGATRWSCVLSKRVKIVLEKWKDDEWAERHKSTRYLCSMGFVIESENHVDGYYGGRRALDLEICLDYIQEFKKLTRNQEWVCFNGESGQETYNVPFKKPERFWLWRRIKTQKGCMSYFSKDCS